VIILKFIKIYIKPIIIFAISLILVPFILTIPNLFNINTTKIFIIILYSLLMFILGFIIGKKCKRLGYLKGLIFSLICILILTILSLIFNFKLNINSLIYYIILILSTTFGSMIGITIKNKK